MHPTATMTRERQDLLETLAKHRGFLRQTIEGMSAEQIRERSTVSALTLGAIVQHVTEMEVQWGEFIDRGADAMAGMTPEKYAAMWTLDADVTADSLLAAYDAAAPATTSGCGPSTSTATTRSPKPRGSRPARGGRRGGCSCTSSPRPPSTRATPTSSARPSTARRRWARPTSFSPISTSPTNTPAGEGRLAGTVLEEAGDTGRGVLGAEDLDECARPRGRCHGERAVEPFVDRALGQSHRHDRARRELGGPGDRGGLDLVGRDHAVDQPDRERLVGPHLPAAPDQLLGAVPGRRAAAAAGSHRRRG